MFSRTGPPRTAGGGDWPGSRKGIGTRIGSLLNLARNFSFLSLSLGAEDAEKQRDRMCNWVLDLKDQKYDVQKEIWKLEQDLNGKKEELAQLEARKKELEASGLKGPIVTPSVSGLSQGGASAETRAPKKKKKNKQKRHPGLLSQERQEFVSHMYEHYKSYL